jgi:hypothetical protein
MRKLTIEVKRERVRAGRAGGFARANRMTKKQRHASALKASRVAAAKRTAAAKARSTKARS